MGFVKGSVAFAYVYVAGSVLSHKWVKTYWMGSDGYSLNGKIIIIHIKKM